MTLVPVAVQDLEMCYNKAGETNKLKVLAVKVLLVGSCWNIDSPSWLMMEWTAGLESLAYLRLMSSNKLLRDSASGFRAVNSQSKEMKAALSINR